MIVFGYKTRKERLIRNLIVIALGVMLLFFPQAWFSTFFMIVVIRILGVILLLLGGLEAIVLLGARHFTNIGFLPYVMAFGILMFGLLMLFIPLGGSDKDSKLFLFIKIVSGVALLWYGLSDLISGWKIGKAVDEYEIRRTKEAPSQPSSDKFSATDLDSVKEVEYRKED